jgi:hypothetical protein
MDGCRDVSRTFGQESGGAFLGGLHVIEVRWESVEVLLEIARGQASTIVDLVVGVGW